MSEDALAHEIHEMKIEQQDSEVEDKDTWSIGRVLTDKTLLLPLLLVCSLQAGQQMSGINAVRLVPTIHYYNYANKYCFRYFSIPSPFSKRLIYRI